MFHTALATQKSRVDFGATSFRFREPHLSFSASTFSRISNNIRAAQIAPGLTRERIPRILGAKAIPPQQKGHRSVEHTGQ